MRRLIIPALAAIILTACSPKQTGDVPAEDNAIKVNVAKVRKEKLLVRLQYSGTIEASRTIPVTFQSNGVVEKVLVDIGDNVKKGQLLAAIDDTDSEKMYRITLAKYNQAKDAYDRLKIVYDKGSLPEIKWVEMETNLAQAKASLEIARSNLDKCSMYAPADGLVGRRNIEEGMSSLNIVSAPLEIVEINNIYIKISVPENEISMIVKGDSAQICVAAVNNTTCKGTVSHISPVADQISRTYEVKILVANNDLKLRPGMICDVTLNKSLQRYALLIPYQSVTTDNENNACVYVLDKSINRVKKQIVVTGQYQGSDLEITQGLHEGDMIVCDGKEKLIDNTLVKI